MNDELVTAKAAVVTKLLVIAPYSAHGLTRPTNGVSIGKSHRQRRPARKNVAGPLCCAVLNVSRSASNKNRSGCEGRHHQCDLRLFRCEGSI